MGFGCSHNFEYSQGHFQCSKCGNIASEKQFKRNHNKSYVTIVIIGLVIIGGIYAYANYDIKVDEQKLDQMIPLKMVEQKFDELYETIPTELIQSTLQNFADSIPIKIEEKTLTLEDRLVDCSKYKKEYLESYQNVKTTGDSMSAMIGDSLAGVQKTRACEEYNKQIRLQYAPAPYAVSPKIDEKIDDAKQEEYTQARESLAKMAEIRCAEFSQEYLSVSNLSQKDLSRCNLRYMNLNGADLTGAKLTSADLTGADLTGADLMGANLYGVKFNNANLSGANLIGTTLSFALLNDANLSGANFTGCIGITTGEPDEGTLPSCTPIP